MILCLTMMLMMMVSFLNPVKMSFFLTLMSILLSMVFFNMTQNSFVTSALIISFSSGMMILFSFCSMMSTFESKNSSVMKLTLILVISVSSVEITVNTMKTLNTNAITVSSVNTFLIMMMVIVIMVMASINLAMFNPSKKLTELY